MAKKIFVGNLPFSATEDELRSLFAAHGSVESVTIVTDRETGRSRGFGFIEMENGAAGKAIEALDKCELNGRELNVSEAKPRRDDGGGGGGRRDRW